MRRIALTLTLAIAISALFNASAEAQALHGSWIRLVARGTGMKVDLADDSARKKGVFAGQCYMRVEYDAASHTYTSRIACEIARRVWAETSGAPTFDLFSDGGGNASNEYAHFTNRKGHTIEGNGTHILSPTFNRLGVLRKVRLTGWGELNGSSSLERGISSFMGGYTTVGNSVTERRVPDAVVSILTSSGPSPSPGAGVAGDVLTLVNGHRLAGATCGGSARPSVAPLSLHTALNAAADRHSLDMATRGFFDHTGSDGSSPFDRIADAGYAGSPQGENIAAGFTSAASVVAGWMSSTGHCNNIMDGRYTHMGAALALSASSRHYWTQTFGGA